ncbi:hypothetical protein NP233_g8805 [Leucocoprinus birnbaumii]|uniref:Uncharacterized protein n=1 Tax=Leucocoprinus birnbaumii TaxID=56174 RepID=A0AAD5YRH8_9AGAR|nr:hypothetical protein NP233_g8805 [Leucocoprinus birnbaumii]
MRQSVDHAGHSLLPGEEQCPCANKATTVSYLRANFQNLFSRLDQYTRYYLAKDWREVRFSKLPPSAGFQPLILLPPFLDSQRIQRVRKYAKTTRVYYSFPSCHYHSDARKRQRSSNDMTDSRWNNSESSEDEKEREDAALDRQEVDRVVREKGLKEKGNLQSAVKIDFKQRCVRVEALNICRSRGPVDPITSMPARYSKYVLNHSRITRRLVDIHPTSPPPGPQAPTLSTPTDVNEFHTQSSHLFHTTSIPPSTIVILFTRPDADHEIPGGPKAHHQPLGA